MKVQMGERVKEGSVTEAERRKEGACRPVHRL